MGKSLVIVESPAKARTLKRYLGKNFEVMASVGHIRDLPKSKFGARSIEAVIEASRAADRLVYGLPELLAPSSARIHAVWRVELEREVDAVRKKTGQRAVW